MILKRKLKIVQNGLKVHNDEKMDKKIQLCTL